MSAASKQREAREARAPASIHTREYTGVVSRLAGLRRVGIAHRIHFIRVNGATTLQHAPGSCQYAETRQGAAPRAQRGSPAAHPQPRQLAAARRARPAHRGPPQIPARMPPAAPRRTAPKRTAPRCRREPFSKQTDEELPARKGTTALSGERLPLRAAQTPRGLEDTVPLKQAMPGAKPAPRDLGYTSSRETRDTAVFRRTCAAVASARRRSASIRAERPLRSLPPSVPRRAVRCSVRGD